jgi:hypothetical protein
LEAVGSRSGIHGIEVFSFQFEVGAEAVLRIKFRVCKLEKSCQFEVGAEADLSFKS